MAVIIMIVKITTNMIKAMIMITVITNILAIMLLIALIITLKMLTMPRTFGAERKLSFNVQAKGRSQSDRVPESHTLPESRMNSADDAAVTSLFVRSCGVICQTM